MRLPVGTTLNGSPLLLDTRPRRGPRVVVTVVGDPGTGKTTLARYLVRWWIADPSRTCTVLPTRAHEYADQAHWGDRSRTHRGAKQSGLTDLLVVDHGDAIEPEELAQLLRHHHGLSLVTSYGPGARHLEARGVATMSLGLLGRDCDNDLAAQGRLDWPTDVIPIRGEHRGHHDVPCHPWALRHASGATS